MASRERKTQSRSYIVWCNKDDPEVRRKKQESLDKLDAIVDQFSEYGIMPPNEEEAD